MTRTASALRSGWATDPGLQRERSQDRVVADEATHTYFAAANWRRP